MPARSHPRPPVDPAVLNGEGGAMWTNLGYWTHPDDVALAGLGNRLPYSAAAAALARRVGLAAEVAPGDVIVDYACGFGDSLLLWIREFGAQRVVGVEPNASVCRVIEARALKWRLADRIRVICGRAEEVSASDAASDVSAVLCVDAAYHFESRRSWLTQLGANAGQGVRLGLADIAIPTGSEHSLRLRALARLMHIPRANLMSARSIAVGCEDAGFTVHSCESIGNEVLDGFIANAPTSALSVSVTRSAVAYARRRQLLDYCVIGARR